MEARVDRLQEIPIVKENNGAPLMMGTPDNLQLNGNGNLEHRQRQVVAHQR